MTSSSYLEQNDLEIYLKPNSLLPLKTWPQKLTPFNYNICLKKQKQNQKKTRNADCHICSCKISLACSLYRVVLENKRRRQTGPGTKAFQEHLGSSEHIFSFPLSLVSKCLFQKETHINYWTVYTDYCDFIGVFVVVAACVLSYISDVSHYSFMWFLLVTPWLFILIHSFHLKHCF